MAAAFLNNLDTYPLTWNSSRNKQDTSLIATYGVSSVGKVCQFNINAHVHLGGI
ncbi:hypothetical protein KDW_25370 [Dictyobacter vulcani]|uniref:Uncharacterized protein n=1 Tax=Dictyobacter vulcani TaxID=2607529 RepID=A0A5J4KKI8_9CHLR|nr:hypothetical protein KDW_25370 [Dictyobacter vulcani]